MNAYRRFLNDNGPGLAGSVALHGAVLLLILWMIKTAAPEKPQSLRSVFVEIVRLGEETTSPAEPRKAPAPAVQAAARRAATAHSPPEAVQPHASKPSDDLDNRLNALSKLKAPETDSQILTGPGESRAESESSDAPAGSDAAYALRDYVRAQVLRRWSLDLSLLGKRKWIVTLRVVMKASGEIAKAEIVDRHRYVSDAAFHQIAMSARNAVLLASPILLPAGTYPPETEITLDLDPKDAMR